MKNLFPIIVLILCFIAAYLLQAAVIWDFNPAHWERTERMAVLLMGLFFLWALWRIGNRAKSYDEFLSNRKKKENGETD